MGEMLLKLKTRESLLRELRDSRRPSAEEVREQRVSFVFGTLDSDSRMTREEVRKILESETK